MSFRNHPKAGLQVQIPVEIVRAVGIRAVNEGKPPNRLVAELLCQALEIDPTVYGIGPDRSDRSETSCLSN